MIVVDTSVLVNFLRIDRMDLFSHYDRGFVITDHVSAEITDHYTEQRVRLIKSVSDGTLRQEAITRTCELSIFGALSTSKTLGSGECSAIALAVCHGHTLAIDDRRAIGQARSLCQDLKILRTQDLLTSMVSQRVLSSEEAEAIKDMWVKKHRFVIKDAGHGLRYIASNNWFDWRTVT